MNKVAPVKRFQANAFLQSRSCLELEARGGEELFNESLKVSLSLVSDGALNADGFDDMASLGVHRLEVHLLKLSDLAGLDLVEVATDTSVENTSLLLNGHGHVLLLLKELGELLTSVEELLGGGIEIRAELSEGGDLTVLSELELHGARHLLHGLDLGGGTDTRHREADVNGGADTLMEKIVLEEDLTISDRDNVSGDIGGEITSLGLDDGEGSEGAGTVGLVHLGRTLEETRMEIENITRVSLSAWGSSEEEGHLSVRDGLLGEIVIDDERVLAVVTEVLANGASRVG